MSATAPLLLVLDAGGTNLRATAVDAGGEPVAAAVVDTPHVVDAPPLGRRYDPEALWQAACTATRSVLARVGADGVAGVAATGQRLACAFVDRAGEAVYVGPNTDARGVMHGWQVDEAAEGALYARTGRGMALLFAPARLLWFRENRPEEYGRVAGVLGLGDWLAQRLCGEGGVEASGAVELLAVDVFTGEYWTELWERLDLDPGWLPPQSPAGARLGAVSAPAATATGLGAGTPVAVCAPDSTAAMLGAGVAAPGRTLVLAGSTMPVLATAAAPVADPARRTWTGRHPVAGLGINESNAGTTGFGWAWVVEHLVGALCGLSGDAAHRRAEDLATSAPPGSHGALSFTGGASVMNATAFSSFLPRMAVTGWPQGFLEPAVGAGDVLRSALESVAFSARANLEQAEAARGTGSGEVVVAGGMARSALFVQMLADVTGRPLLRPHTLEATAVGAAVCAAVAAGVAPSLATAVAAMSRLEPAAEPDGRTGGAYSAAYGEWRALYDKMESL